ncbi:IclR family transcriptional regulator [Mycobacterium aquaticum]|uniref:IclR family transcriptional regulator n=1 Tax=Mycobacterium aquaticum TaxID=1927124 RepID=UPI0009F6A746|nr:IclR family transcriptional regulator [Mycobacterium aquaticum]
MPSDPEESGDDSSLSEASEPVGRGRDYSVRAVERVCSILDLLQESVDGITLIDVSNATGLPKASAFRYMWTLEARRYIEREPASGRFRLGLAFASMQSRQLEVLRERSRPWLEQLRDEFGETTNLGILDGDAVIYIDVVESRRGVRLAAARGSKDSLHSTALGKAIAAHLPESRVREILQRSGMPQLTVNTLASVDAYLADLAWVRHAGYAVDNGENEVDGRCVAVPLLGSGLPAALSVSAPSARFPVQQVETVAKALQDAAANIATSPPPEQS